jgi:hypothetical protein
MHEEQLSVRVKKNSVDTMFSYDKATELLIIPHPLVQCFGTTGPKQIVQIHSHEDDIE